MAKKTKIEKQKNKELLTHKLTKEASTKKLQDECRKHLDDSTDQFADLRESWDDKEAMLVCALQDEVSTDESTVKSQVFDPRLSTIVFERAARVMAQNPQGKAFPVSVNDIGKSKFMNLLLEYYTNNANYWHSMIIKLRIMDLYSMVYGTMFGLVPWMVNEKTDYIGPEFVPLPIRSCFPQPGATSINDSDWFQVSSMKSIEWLDKQEGWINIDELKKQVNGTKEETNRGKGDTKPDDQKSFVETEWYPTELSGDKTFPKVWLQTEYRRDKWITFAPNYGNLIVRKIDNPFDNNELPIVAKHAFPLMDSIIGLGEFERGKTLQLAINSLINLYLDGVKYSIFPPVHVDPTSVIQSSIKWGAGEKWLMKHPGQDVQMMAMSPQGLETFNSTYGFMVSALLNQAGSTSISQPANTEQLMGRTPQAIRAAAARESSRDEWDRVMMEDSIKSVYSKWIQMIVKKQDKKVAVRVFGEEAKKLTQDYPDVAEFFQEGNYGIANIGKEQLAPKYDYELDSGATLKKDTEAESQAITEVLGLVLKTPQVIQAMQVKGKDLDIGELFKRWVISKGIKDYDKIITDFQPTGQMMGQPGQISPPNGQAISGQVAPATPQPTFQDQDIARTFQTVQEMMGQGVPTK